MKKSLILTAVFALCAITIYSQTEQEEIDYFQSLFGMGKKAIVANFITLDEPVATEFWALYDNMKQPGKPEDRRGLIFSQITRIAI